MSCGASIGQRGRLEERAASGEGDEVRREDRVHVVVLRARTHRRTRRRREPSIAPLRFDWILRSGFSDSVIFFYPIGDLVASELVFAMAGPSREVLLHGVREVEARRG